MPKLAPSQITGFSVILDSRIHRTVLLSEPGNLNDISLLDDYTVYITSEIDPATSTTSDYITIIKEGHPAKKIKCAALRTPPDAGTNIPTVTEPFYQCPCYVYPEQHRILELNKNLSADSSIDITVKTSFPPGSLGFKDTMVLTSSIGTTSIDVDDKIPPKVG
jgi:hypothetical protein